MLLGDLLSRFQDPIVAEQALAGRHAIRSIPTLALFKQGHEVDRVAGALPPQQLQAWLAQAG